MTMLVHAEWTKFRTVRGWVITMIAAIVTTTFLALLSSGTVNCPGNGSGCAAPPVGPGGQAVQDAFYFVHQPVTGNGTITVELTSLTGRYSPDVVPSGPVSRRLGGHVPAELAGVQPWSKAGIIIKANLSQGSAYAAMMATGTHGVRMQWNYVNDRPGLTGNVSASSPRWLRLTRAGGTITGYDSADGSHWSPVGAVTLPGLAATVQTGFFAASPDNFTLGSAGIGVGTASFGPTQDTGVFRHVALSWTGSDWTGTNVGGVGGQNGAQIPGLFRQRAGAFTVTGSGDIAPQTTSSSLWDALFGSWTALIALIVVGTMFITAEYRRGLIRTSLTASPRRGRLLAAKAVVVGVVSFGTGLIAAVAAIAVGIPHETASHWLPIPALTVVRMVTGTGALLAVAAVLALAIGTVMRRSAAAVATVLAAIFIPYLLAVVPSVFPLSVEDWLLRITPAAAFSVQQPFPQYPQVIADYNPAGGYFPLAPWAGFAVECAWAAAALILASYLLRRRDA